MRRSTPLEAARILSLCLFAALAVAPCAAQSSGKASRTSRRAVLVRGSEAVKGLPNFGRNALPGLYGEYRLEPTAKGAEALPERILVWMTQEALYLSPADWRFSRVEGRAAWIAAERTGSANDAGRRLVLFDRPFGSEGQGAEPRRWTVLVSLPSDAEGSAPEYGRFVAPFLDRLAFFLSSARSAMDASFPAILEW